MLELDSSNIKQHNAKSVENTIRRKDGHHMRLPMTFDNQAKQSFNKNASNSAHKEQPKGLCVGDRFLGL